MKNKFTILACLLFFAISVSAQNKPFKMFNQVRYSSSPASLAPFLLPLKISNESVLLNASDSTPNQTAIRDFAQTCPAGVTVSLDLETWSYSPNSTLTSTINKFLATIGYFKSVNTVSPIGFYGVPPKQAYEWKSIDPVNNRSGYTTWKRISDSMARFAVNIDVFQPSFYAYEPDTTSWRKMVDTTIAATKRYSTTKPIYAYIWPQYHESSVYANQLQFIDTAIWSYELQTLYDRADGVIIWTSNKNADGSTIYWDPNMPWWQVTKSFMVQKSLVQPFVLDQFSVKRTGNSEEISWATSVDTTSAKYEVERSTDGINYIAAGGSVTPSMSYYTQNAYQYLDNSTESNLYYRLKITRKDGTVNYSDVKTAFASGILAVLRIGGVNGTNGTAGSTTPNTSGSPIHIDKYSISAGAFTFQSSIDLPTANANNIFASSSTNEGYITQSGNEQWLSVMGYAAKSATGTIYSTTSNPNLARTLGLTKYDGTVDLTTALSNFPVSGTAATAQSSITNNGGDLWAVTNQGVSPMGVLYTTPGATDATAAPSVIVTAGTPAPVSSVKSLAIYGGDLYYTANSGNRIGTVSANGGLPTTAGTSVMTALPVATGSTAFSAFAPSQMVMFDLQPSILGYDVMYVTNASTTTTQAGVYKYCKNADGQWVSFGTFGSIATDGTYFGITGEVINGLPVLYVTRGVSATQNLATNQLIQLTETGGYNANMSATVTATTDATVSGKSGTIRGVAFFPAPSYYYKGTGNLNDVANWGTNIDGTGTNPLNFTADEQTFFINNGTNATLSNDFVVSGVNSKIILGDGTKAATLTIPATFSITSEMDVYNNAVLNIENMQAPTLHFIAKNSTINFMSPVSQNISPMAYGNLSNNNNSSAVLNGTITVAGNMMQSGLLKGNATLIVPNGLTNNGTIAPGNSAGLMNVTGDFTNATAGILAIELGGNTAAGTDYDQLAVTGNAVINGTLNISLVNNFAPMAGQTFTILTAAAVSGSFSTVNLPSGVMGNVSYTSNSVIVTITSAVLPLKLVDFAASLLQNRSVQLVWETATEDNLNRFEIEKSSDVNTAFVQFAQQKAFGTGNHDYQQFDANPVTGANFYRLKMVDNDGHFTYSKTVRINVTNNSAEKLVIYPNPVSRSLTLSHAVAASNAVIRINFADGKTVITKTALPGSVQSTLDVSRLQAGWYVVTITNGTKMESASFVKKE